MRSFVFLHEPIKPPLDKPAHLLQNRASLIQALGRHPNARRIFHGHDHYASQGRVWGMNISHIDRTAKNVDGTAGLVVKVDAKNVTMSKFDSNRMLIPTANEYDLDPLFASRLFLRGGKLQTI
jgi:hypothetical protein